MSTNRFDRAAADWDKKDQRVQLAAAIAAGIAALPLHPAMEALEYGCGTGLVGLTLAPQLKSLTAADSSPGMLATLTDKIAAAGLANVYPLHLDLHGENCPRQFDLIFSAMTLHHLAEVGPVIEKLVTGLKTGGYIALADLDCEDGSFHGENSEGVMHHGFDRDELGDILQRLGCRIIQAQTVHTVVKPNAAGVEQSYPVFLLTAKKELP